MYDNVTLQVTPVRKIPFEAEIRKGIQMYGWLGYHWARPKTNQLGVNRLIVAEKLNGKLWVCLDPGSLNKTIKSENLNFPTAKEIFSQMSGASYFTKLLQVAKSQCWKFNFCFLEIFSIACINNWLQLRLVRSRDGCL